MNLRPPKIAATRKDLATLHAKFNTIRALSARLSVLPLNDFSVPTLALELRSALQNASQRLTDLDGEIQLQAHTRSIAMFIPAKLTLSCYALHRRHWDDENEVGVAMATGQIRLTPMEVYTRRHLYDEVAAKFRQRVKDIQREAKGEERERKERAQERPEGLDDWLAASRRDLKVSIFYTWVLAYSRIDVLNSLLYRTSRGGTRNCLRATSFKTPFRFSRR